MSCSLRCHHSCDHDYDWLLHVLFKTHWIDLLILLAKGSFIKFDSITISSESIYSLRCNLLDLFFIGESLIRIDEFLPVSLNLSLDLIWWVDSLGICCLDSLIFDVCFSAWCSCALTAHINNMFFYKIIIILIIILTRG